MNENLDIFICTHKDFNVYPRNSVYSIIASEGQLKDQYEIDILSEKDGKYTYMQKYINEFTRMHWVSQNVQLKDYVGFCHYRRYFNFFDNVPNMNNLFNTYDLIATKPLEQNVKIQFNKSHNIYDYITIQQIILANYKDITFDELMSYDNSLYTCNMFIMKNNDFYKYIDFVSNIIDEYIKFMKFNNVDDIKNYIERVKGAFLKNNFTYQTRVIGYLTERISSIYFKKYYNNILEYDIFKIE